MGAPRDRAHRLRRHLSRNREDSVLYKRMLERNRVRVVSLNAPVDDSSAGRMLEAIPESVDELYSQNLAQDISRGLRKNASVGFRNGGPPPIGYRKRRTGPSEGAPRIVLEPDPPWAPLVQRMFRMALAGEGVTAIAATLHVEGARTPRGKPILKPPEPIRVEDAHEPLVSPEDFAAVQRTLATLAPEIVSPNTLANDYLLGGLVFCARCGGLKVHPPGADQRSVLLSRSQSSRWSGSPATRTSPARATSAVVSNSQVLDA